jgi:hypothetical protein
MAKVRLSDIQSQLVKRGRDAYENEALFEELSGLDPNDPDSACVFEEAKGDPTDEKYVNHKNLWRGRVGSVATQVGIPDGALSVIWTVDGDMVVTYKR